MPTELLSLPPTYTVIGLYRLLTDASIRDPVLAKVKHAAIRGAIVGAAYATLGWNFMDWIVKRFVLRGRSERVVIGTGALAISVDLVFYTHVLILLPQLGAILKFFMRKNLRIARARAYNLTVASRRKPAEFWSQGYVEEWQQPPQPTRQQLKAWGDDHHTEKWVRIMLWWPCQMVIRNYILLPLSPNLPLLAPLAISAMRALGTAEYLHRPYFKQKHMNTSEVWTWVEERKWAYRGEIGALEQAESKLTTAFGFAASLLESLPIIGIYFSISNRVGAAMWAHDYEKRQHLFAHHILQPLPPSRVGLFGSGTPMDITPEVLAAQREIEARWSLRPSYRPIAGDDDAGSEPAYPPPAYSEQADDDAAAAAARPDAIGAAVPPPLPPRHEEKKRVPPPLPPRHAKAGDF